MNVDPQALRDLNSYSRGKKRRLLVNICPGCKKPLHEATVYGRFASPTDPVVIDYYLCSRCSKKATKRGRKAQLFADRIERNLEALGMFTDLPGTVSA